MRLNQKFYKVTFKNENDRRVFFCIGYNLDKEEKLSAIEIYSNKLEQIDIDHNKRLTNKEALQLLGSTCLTEKANRAYEKNVLRHFFLDNFEEDTEIIDLN